jgi:hypothetical protein
MLINFIARLLSKPEPKKKTKKKTKKERRFVTFKQLAKLHPGFSLHTLRHHRYYNTRGFNGCVRKAGRRLYVDLSKFEDWVDGRGRE